jgi:hypothetical protein
MSWLDGLVSPDSPAALAGPAVFDGPAALGSPSFGGWANACHGGNSVAALASEIASGRTPSAEAGGSAAAGESQPEAKLSHGDACGSSGSGSPDALLDG